MSLTAVSTVSLTLPGKNLIEEPLHQDNFAVVIPETNQAENANPTGITLQSHEVINDRIQLENKQESGAHVLDVVDGSNTVVTNDVTRIEDNSGKETGKEIGKETGKETGKENEKEGQREPEKSIDNVSASQEQDDPKQDRLLLDGPRQRYRVEKGANIPDLQSDREVLIRVNQLPLGTWQLSNIE